jgi:hypothetical protein
MNAIEMLYSAGRSVLFAIHPASEPIYSSLWTLTGIALLKLIYSKDLEDRD